MQMFHFCRQNVFHVVAVFGLVTGLGLTEKVSQANEPFAVQQFRSVVEDKADMVLFFAHPSVTRTGLDYCGMDHLTNGYKATYRFKFDSPFTGEPCYSELRFYLNADGGLDFVTNGDRNCLWAPLAGSNLVIKAVRKAIQEDPELQNNRELVRAVESADSKTACEAMLRMLQN